MEREDLLYLYKKFLRSVEFCNIVCEKLGQEQFDKSELPMKFTLDILTTAGHAIGADGVVSPAELEKLNAVMCHLGRQLSQEDGDGIAKLVQTKPYDVPVTLVMMVLCTHFRILYTEDPAEEVLGEEIPEMEKMLELFAEMTTSMVDQPGEAEKKAITNCLTICSEYIEETLGFPFKLTERTQELIG